MAWNINGLIRKLSDVDFIESLNSYDVILFSETWISDKHLINLEINGFDSFHIFGHKSHGVKKGRQSGGISVYFREQYKNKISVIEKNNFGIIWLKFHHDLFRFNEDVYICHAYIPPASSKVLIDKDFDFFEEIEK
ncbi:MAG: endonuclease/exonuclease/phosphatase family protein, partial [Candidatus Thiodiazotropha taylori]